MNGFTILIVEDDPSIGSILQTILQEEGYQARWVKDGRRLLEDVKGADLLILDIMLPGENGYELSKKLQSYYVSLPTIFLTARSDMDSKLKGLSLGEDYLVKPFDPRELLARMKLLINNKYGVFAKVKDLFIDSLAKRIYKKDIHSEIQLTVTERKLFFYLYENKNRILTREQFFVYLWPMQDVKNSVLNVHVKKLRDKLGDDSSTIIETIHGEGYRLNTLNSV